MTLNCASWVKYAFGVDVCLMRKFWSFEISNDVSCAVRCDGSPPLKTSGVFPYALTPGLQGVSL